MRLNEEYIKRNNLNIPVVLYDHDSNVFLKTKDAPHRWGVFGISWRWGHNTPGCFYCGVNTVKHNGYKNGEIFESDKTVGHSVNWEDYETYIVRITTALRMAGWEAIPSEERKLATWEMFLYAYDSWIASNMCGDKRLYELIERSTTKDLDINTRITAFRSAYRILAVHEQIKDVLQGQFLPMAEGHSAWLEKLINE